MEPKIRMNLRPTRWRIAYIPQLTPMKPRHVFMIEYWNGLSMPAISKKYVV